MASLSILVVDDEQIVALDIRRTLERLGYVVPAIIADGESAIAAAKEHSPDLVLMDIRLKGDMDGIEAARVISTEQGIPIIFLTAYSDEATLDRAKSSSPFGFLIKPFEERELHSTIEIALLKHKSVQTLDQARQKAERAHLAKAAFLADMSHEIRNSLNGIVGMTDLALDTNLDDEQREYMTTVLDSAENLLGILRDVMDISRLEARQLELISKPFEVTKAVAKAVRTIKPEADKKNLRVSWYLGPEVPPIVAGDPIRLQQVLTNLLGNAIKFTEYGEIAVEVTQVTVPRMASLAEPSSSVNLLFSVRDTGAGIPEDRHTNIFERYQQVATEENGEVASAGAGLGLAICKELVEMMGGTIWVRSREGQGSTFYFTSRFVVAPKREETGLPIQPVELVALPPMRVAVADDNLVSRKLVSVVLEKKGHYCHAVENGLQLLEALETERYDLVVTNIQMPQMGGIEAVRKIRAGLVANTPADIPVVAVTAHALKGDRERFIEAGMTDYVAKPIHASTFYSIIARAVRGESENSQRPGVPSEHAIAPPLLDANDVITRMEGDAMLVREMWRAYLEEVPGRLVHFAQALEQQDMDQAMQLLNALCAASVNVGAYEAACLGERCLGAMRNGAEIGALRSDFESSLAQTLDAIQAGLGNLG